MYHVKHFEFSHILESIGANFTQETQNSVKLVEAFLHLCLHFVI